MNNRWLVYVLRCSDGSLYTDVTNNLARRVRAHNAGTGGAYTRSRRPVQAVFNEKATSRSSALRREAQIKRLPRPEKARLIRRKI